MLNIIGFLKHDKVIDIFKKTSIAVFVQDGKSHLEELV